MRAVVPSLDFVKVGDVLVDKYRVESVIGSGGMGVVLACTHLALGERVAVKLLRPEAMERQALERFTREAKATARLKSPYVARVMDVGVLDTGVPYMVMEYLEGHDLGAVLAQRGHLPVAEVIDLMLPVASALAEAHANGVVHRDIKPTNLFLTNRADEPASIKLLDFGISKALEGEDVELTQTQSMLGTPAYMSPEQMRSARLVDERTDVWSLGSVIYELLEGTRPFQGKTFSELCVVVATDPPTPMIHTPPALQMVVLRCIAKNPDDRFGSMWELGKALQPFASDHNAAAILVERMHRQLRRSRGEWNVGSDPLIGETSANPAALVDPPLADAAVVSSRADTELQPPPLGETRGDTPAERELVPPSSAAASPRSTPSIATSEPTARGSRARMVWTITGLLGVIAGIVGLVVVRSNQPAQPTAVITQANAHVRALAVEPPPATGMSSLATPPTAPARTAKLSIRANTDATFVIDDEVVGRGHQLEVPAMAVGDHRLEVRARHYATVRRPFSLVHGEGLALDIQLVRATSAAPTTSKPPSRQPAKPASKSPRKQPSASPRAQPANPADKNRILPM